MTTQKLYGNLPLLGLDKILICCSSSEADLNGDNFEKKSCFDTKHQTGYLIQLFQKSWEGLSYSVKD